MDSQRTTGMGYGSGAGARGEVKRRVLLGLLVGVPFLLAVVYFGFLALLSLSGGIG